MAKKFLVDIDLANNNLINAGNMYSKTYIDALTTTSIASVVDKRYVTDAQLTILSNTSGTNTGDETVTTIKSKLGITTLSGSNTGDQTITLTGDVTGSGTSSFAATVATGSITLAKMANLNANSILGNNTSESATPIALTSTQVKTLLNIQGSDVSGNISGNAANVTGIVAVANGGTGASTATDARLNLGTVGKYSSSVGNGILTSFTLTHNLNTTDVMVSVFETATKTLIYTDVLYVDANNITINFTTAPTANQYKVIVIG